MLQAAILVIFPFCMAFSVVSDLLSMTIANRVSILLLAGFMVIAPMTGMAWDDYGLHLAAGALVLCVTFGLFAVGGMGGGDAKLLAATAVWMGPGIELVAYMVYASFIGGALTLFLVFFRGSSVSALVGNNVLLKNIADQKVGIPYGIALGISGLIVYPDTALGHWAINMLASG